MKIAIISVMEGYPWGGSEELWVELAKEALNRGDEVLISFKKWNKVAPKLTMLEELGAKVYLRDSEVIYPSIAQRAIGKIIGRNPQKRKMNDYEIIFSQNPDLILVNEGGFGGILYYPDVMNLILQTKIPYITLSQQNREWGSYSMNRLANAREIYANAKQTLFVSERNGEVAKMFLCHDLPNARVVRNPVNLNSTSPVDYPLNSRALLACVGRLFVAQKGQDLLLRALAAIKNDYSFQLTFYGTGGDEQYLKELALYLDLADQVIFKGYVKNVREIWKHNQMLVLTSHREGIPLAVVEAMLTGRPCLVTDVAGNNEWIEDGISGFIAAAPTVNLIEEKLREAFSVFENWSQIGKIAREVALKKYHKEPGKALYREISE